MSVLTLMKDQIHQRLIILVQRAIEILEETHLRSFLNDIHQRDFFFITDSRST